MSWDVFLLRLPDDITSVQEIPADHTPAPLGRRDDVLAAVARAVPEADLSDPGWGTLSGPTWSIELNIGSNDPVESIMLHIRGSGDDVLTPVFRLAESLRCGVIDCTDGELIAPGQSSGWHSFQQFRDQVVGPSQ
ncbi:hypothetical protein ABZZ04_38515 [Streptomyces sp. NPDC006435]|uniref:hypothetical protein n=1 Tax=Streptomyces sp. NPDC006435 TaxID=3154300 RepID=UPI0033B51CB8